MNLEILWSHCVLTATKDAVLLCPQRKRGWQKLEALHQNYDGGDASFTQ